MQDFVPRGIDCDSQSIDDIDSDDLNGALALWQQWRGGRLAPTWTDVDLPALPATLLPMTTVVDVIDGGRDYCYRYWGSGLTTLFGRDESGTYISSHAVSQSGKLRFEQFNEVVASKTPRVFMTIYAVAEDTHARKLNLRLPVCDGGRLVTKILSLSTMEAPRLGRFENLHAFWPTPSGD